jgi:ssDNA-binding Zn-finger/Zn-ribbon topoisomerase 1
MTHIRNAKPEIDHATGIPVATLFTAYKCEHCDYVHIVLRDDKGNPFAAAVLLDEMILGVVDVLNNKITSWPSPEANKDANVKGNKS